MAVAIKVKNTVLPIVLLPLDCPSDDKYEAAYTNNAVPATAVKNPTSNQNARGVRMRPRNSRMRIGLISRRIRFS